MNTTEVTATKKQIISKPTPFPKIYFKGTGERLVKDPTEEAEAIEQGWSDNPGMVPVVENRADNLSTLTGAVTSYNNLKRELEEKVNTFNGSWRDLTDRHETLKREYAQLRQANGSLQTAFDELAEKYTLLANQKPQEAPKVAKTSKPIEVPAVSQTPGQ